MTNFSSWHIQERFDCVACEKSFAWLHEAHKHMKRAHGATVSKVYICPLCTFTARNPATWEAHIQTEHLFTTGKRFACEICRASYREANEKFPQI